MSQRRALGLLLLLMLLMMLRLHGTPAGGSLRCILTRICGPVPISLLALWIGTCSMKAMHWVENAWAWTSLCSLALLLIGLCAVCAAGVSSYLLLLLLLLLLLTVLALS